MESDRTPQYLDFRHHFFVCDDVYGTLSIKEKPAGGVGTEFFFCHLRKEEVILCPGIEILESVDHYCMCMLADAILYVVCFGRSPSRRVLGLFIRTLPLCIKAVGLKVTLFFTIVAVAHLGCATASFTPTACLCDDVSGSAPVAVVVVYEVGKSQSLVGPVYWLFLPFPRRHRVLCFMNRFRVGFLALDVVVLYLCHRPSILAYVLPEEECSREELFPCHIASSSTFFFDIVV